MSTHSDYTTENYLKAIVKHLSDPANTKVSTGTLATLVGVTSPTATTMMKKLEKQGYVSYLSHHGCTLTTKGARFGLNILRRHRLLETFLVTNLGLGWEAAHQEAERLEHAASDDLIEAISERLGHPTKDPHGNLIPSPGQESFTVQDIPFKHAPRAITHTVSRLTTESRMASYLKEQSIVVGAAIVVQAVDETIGLATVEVDGTEKIIPLRALDHFFHDPSPS